MALADTNYRYVYVDIVVTDKTVILPFLNDLLYGFHAGITQWWTSFRNRRSKCTILLCRGWGIGANRNMLWPFGGFNLIVKKRVLNYRLCRARRYVECVFGILSNKWRIFQRPLNVSPDFTVDIVKACVVMRISFRERGVCKFKDAMTVTGLEDVSDGQLVRGGLTANNVRNKVADYFSNR